MLLVKLENELDKDTSKDNCNCWVSGFVSSA